MPAYKDNKGRWYCKFYTDTWQGEKKQVLKRGFATKKEALAYEYEYKANTSHSPDITLRTLYNEFMKDYKANYRPTSYNITRSIIERHILPYFADTPINSITPMMYRKWQNEIKIKKLTDSPSELKTDTSKRVISMPQFVMDRIRAFLDALAADSRFPFLVWTPAIIRHRLARYCKYAGIEPISPHTLRHSHATLLITNSIPINIISKRLGHANITTTLNIYSHCFKNSDADVVALLDSIVSK